jgi:predicted nucleic acid-binding protein
MHYFFLDASALVKRYHKEPGTEVVDSLMDHLLNQGPKRMVVSLPGLAEVIAALWRKQNEGRLSSELFGRATARLLEEVEHVDLQSVDDIDIWESLALIKAHSLNASDALYLRQALRTQRLLSILDHDLVLVASDRQLLRAAETEGLLTADPEKAEVDLTALL